MITSYLQNLYESTIIISLFCVFYIAVFQQETSFRQNRIFLMLGILFSIIMPFVEFSPSQQLDIIPTIELKPINIFPDNISDLQSGSSQSAINIFFGIYLFGASLFVARFAYQLLSLASFFKSSKITHQGDVKIVLTGKKHSAFSFLNYVFIDDKTELSSDLEIVTKHEIAHISQKHSVDLILFELLLIMQWFNPLVWIYGKKIKENHEFLADKALLATGVHTEKYQKVLLNTHTCFNYDLINNFNHSLTFKRLIMMTKIDSKRKSIIKLIAVIPILFVSVYFVSCTKNAINYAEAEGEKGVAHVIGDNGKVMESVEVVTFGGKKNLKRANSKEPVFMVVEKMPEYEGGDFALRKFIAEHVDYPTEAKNQGIEGKVYVRFVVNTKGAVERAHIVKGVHEILNNEALRVVSSIPPKWKPGEQKGRKVNVHYTVPIIFRLQ